jgi:hypothetical protein
MDYVLREKADAVAAAGAKHVNNSPTWRSSQQRV